MSDVKDILGVPRGGAPLEKQDKPKEQKLVKPKGMSREAFALLSSTHPLVPSDLVNELGKKADGKKDKPKKRGQVTFQWQKFKNPARTDDLELQHWVKCYKDAVGNITPAEKGDYPFAKYNKRAKIFKYNDEEWKNLIAADADWSREETDYLITLSEEFDLRWMAIADRYEFPDGKPRNIEDIKGRYYSVARQLLVGREGVAETVANNVLVKHPYSSQSEKDRKQGLELLFKRSHEQDAEEEELLQEAMKIEAKRRAENSGARRANGTAANAATPAVAVAPITITEFTNDVVVGTPPLFDMNGEPSLPTAPPPAQPGGEPGPVPRVVARVSHTRDLILSMIEKIQPQKNQKAVEGSMAELKLPDLPRAASRAVCGAYVSLLREVIELMELKRQLATKAHKRGRALDDGEDGGGKRQKTAGGRSSGGFE